MFQQSNAVKQTYVPDSWLTVTVHDQHKAKTVKSHTVPRYWCKHCSPSPRWPRETWPRPRGITFNVVPITAVSPRLPRYSRRHHYRTDLYSLNTHLDCQWNNVGNVSVTCHIIVGSGK